MRFTHVYVEERARDYELTGEILRKAEGATIVPIKHYKDVFDRARQDIRLQKARPALVLAVRDGNRIFEGAPVCQSFGQRNFYYASTAMNCPFDCEYCYLKGMYPSGNIVVFVNFEDYEKDVKSLLSGGPVYICASYDSDLTVLNSLTGLADRWIALAGKFDDLLVELRTKGAPSSFSDSKNVIYAFTVSPKEIAARYEIGAPSPDARIASAKRALDSGCRVRLCLDPMIKVRDWQKIYGDFVDDLAKQIDLDKVTDYSVGTFRISKDYLGAMRRAYPDSEIAWYPYHVKDGVCQYVPEDDREMQEFMCRKLTQYVDKEKLFLWN